MDVDEAWHSDRLGPLVVSLPVDDRAPVLLGHELGDILSYTVLADSKTFRITPLIVPNNDLQFHLIISSGKTLGANFS
jgi:hypothetical protein